MSVSETVQKNLQSYLSVRDINITDLSRMSGVSQSTVWRYAHGIGEPTVVNLKKIADSLDTDVSSLIN